MVDDSDDSSVESLYNALGDIKKWEEEEESEGEEEEMWEEEGEDMWEDEEEEMWEDEEDEDDWEQNMEW